MVSVIVTVLVTCEVLWLCTYHWIKPTLVKFKHWKTMTAEEQAEAYVSVVILILSVIFFLLPFIVLTYVFAIWLALFGGALAAWGWTLLGLRTFGFVFEWVRKKVLKESAELVVGRAWTYINGAATLWILYMISQTVR